MPLFFYRIFVPIWEKHLTVLLYGSRSAGKSLQQAKYARAIFKYLDKLYYGFPDLPQAIVLSNQLFNAEFAKPYLEEREEKKGKRMVKHQRRLYYWESIQQLKYCPREDCWLGKKKHPVHDCYILCDDIATIIPADSWADTPRWFRKIWSEAGHAGVHCLANIQDPISCDINFRRYVDYALKFNKIIGSRRPEVAKPEVKYIWGFYSTRKIKAEELYKNGDMSEMEIKIMKEEHPDLYKDSWVPSMHWIGRKATMIYDTLQNMPEYMPNSMEHIEYKCVNPKCGYVHTKHRVI